MDSQTCPLGSQEESREIKTVFMQVFLIKNVTDALIIIFSFLPKW